MYSNTQAPGPQQTLQNLSATLSLPESPVPAQTLSRICSSLQPIGISIRGCRNLGKSTDDAHPD